MKIYGLSVKPGDRVEVHPAFDLWARGARYGTVTKVSSDGIVATVKMDHPQVRRLQLMKVEDLKLDR